VGGLSLAWRRWLLGLPAVLAAGYLVVLGVDFHGVTAEINTYGDAVIAPVLGKLAGQAPAGSHVILGHHAYYEEFLFLRATAGLPFYRGLWEVAPILWTLAGFGLLGWAAWRALGRFAAFLTVSAVVCLGSLGRFTFFALNWHGLTVLHTILIGAALVWLAPRTSQISWSRLGLAAAGLGLISALPVASDPLFLEWALVPMGLASAVMMLRTSGRSRRCLATFTLSTGLVALAAGAGIAHAMRASGVGTSQFTFPLLATVPGIVSHLKFLFEGLTALGGGFFFSMSPDLTGFMTLLSGVLVLAALAAGPAAGWRLVARRPPRAAGPQGPIATVGYVSFWLSSLVLQCLVFVISGVPRSNVDSGRYLLAGYVAIMALFPLLAGRGGRRRLALAAAVCVFAISSIVQFALRPFVEYGPYPTAPTAQRLLAFARTYGVHYGYASYWEAPDLTWLTNFRLPIYPINLDCGQEGICPWADAQIDSWYRPRPGTRSLLIADQPPPVAAALADLVGQPLLVRRFGRLTVAVYTRDIATELSPGPVWQLEPEIHPGTS
jgi:hypothetical protein